MVQLMQRWRCHKIVEAEPIHSVNSTTMTSRFVDIGTEAEASSLSQN